MTPSERLRLRDIRNTSIFRLTSLLGLVALVGVIALTTLINTLSAKELKARSDRILQAGWQCFSSSTLRSAGLQGKRLSMDNKR